MNDSAIWAQIFQKWPPKLPQRGVLVATFGEQIPFCGFLRTADALLLERQTPDAVGARKIILPFSQIASLKITDPVGGERVPGGRFLRQAAAPLIRGVVLSTVDRGLGRCSTTPPAFGMVGSCLSGKSFSDRVDDQPRENLP